MKHFPILPRDASRSQRIERLFALHGQVWRQTALNEGPEDRPMTVEALMEFQNRANRSFILPQTLVAAE